MKTATGKSILKIFTPGTLYKFRLDEEDEFPDPAPFPNPKDVHSWSQVIDPNAYSLAG